MICLIRLAPLLFHAFLHLAHDHAIEDAVSQPLANKDHRFCILARDVASARFFRIDGLGDDPGDDLGFRASSVSVGVTLCLGDGPGDFVVCPASGSLQQAVGQYVAERRLDQPWLDDDDPYAKADQPSRACFVAWYQAPSSV